MWGGHRAGSGRSFGVGSEGCRKDSADYSGRGDDLRTRDYEDFNLVAPLPLPMMAGGAQEAACDLRRPHGQRHCGPMDGGSAMPCIAEPP